MSLTNYLRNAYIKHRLRQMSRHTEDAQQARVRHEIVRYLEEHAESDQDGLIAKYLRGHPLRPFPYEFTAEYDMMDIAWRSDAVGQVFIERHGKRLYFPPHFKPHHAVNCYHSLLIEQDHRSPHFYGFAPECMPQRGDVIADIGAAEGIWALDRIETCSRAYIFECDAQWIDALERTFAPWRDKVEIVQKFVGAADDPQNNIITLDTFLPAKTCTASKQTSKARNGICSRAEPTRCETR